MQPNLSESSWSQFQEPNHFILIQFSHSLKGTMGLHFSFEEKGAHRPLPGDNLHLLAHVCLTPQLPFSFNNRHCGAFSNMGKEPTFGLWKCRPRLGQRAFLEAALRSWEPRAWEPECPLSCCSWSRHSAFLKVNREEGTWTGVYKQPSLLRSLPFRFPKSQCAHGLYNEEGFVCWRIFSALLLNSEVRRGWGWDEIYSPLLSFAFPNSPNLGFVCSCPETAAKTILRLGNQKF